MLPVHHVELNLKQRAVNFLDELLSQYPYQTSIFLHIQLFSLKKKIENLNEEEYENKIADFFNSTITNIDKEEDNLSTVIGKEQFAELLQKLRDFCYVANVDKAILANYHNQH